jgi:hypothetical protein
MPVIRNQLVPQDFSHHTPTVEETEIVITGFNCTLLLAETLEMRKCFFNLFPWKQLDYRRSNYTRILENYEGQFALKWRFQC